MFPLGIILGIIMIWCFYFRFMKAVMARKRLIYVEVMDQRNSDFFISRFQAKQNLHLVGEVTQKLRSYNYLFDKYWYMQREYTYIEDINHVEQNQFTSNKQEVNTDKEENKYLKDQGKGKTQGGDELKDGDQDGEMSNKESQANHKQRSEAVQQDNTNNRTIFSNVGGFLNQNKSPRSKKRELDADQVAQDSEAENDTANLTPPVATDSGARKKEEATPQEIGKD